MSHLVLFPSFLRPTLLSLRFTLTIWFLCIYYSFSLYLSISLSLSFFLTLSLALSLSISQLFASTLSCEFFSPWSLIIHSPQTVNGCIIPSNEGSCWINFHRDPKISDQKMLINVNVKIFNFHQNFFLREVPRLSGQWGLFGSSQKSPKVAQSGQKTGPKIIFWNICFSRGVNFWVRASASIKDFSVEKNLVFEIVLPQEISCQGPIC